MNTEKAEKDLLRGVTYTSKGFYPFIAVLGFIILWGLYGWLTLLRVGHVATGLSNFVPWGIFISSYIFFIGISHAGIAVSAATRLFGLDKYKSIARIAELITVLGLLCASLLVVADVGRADRMMNMFIYFFERAGQSPFIGGTLMTMATYLILSIVYLYFSMREDLATYAERVTWKWLYKILVPFYSPDEKESVEKLLWWMALAIIPVMIMVHTAVAWVFGLIVTRAGWFNPGAGIDYVVAAISSGLAAVAALAIILRSLFKWEKYIKAEPFRRFGYVIMSITLLYIYLMFGEAYTALFFSPTAETQVAHSLIFGRFASLYWAVVLGLFISVVALLAPAIVPKTFSLTRTFLACVLIVVMLWIKRVLIVVPGLFAGYPTLPYPVHEWELNPLWGLYNPTWVEWSILAGVFAFAALLYTLFIKVFPIIPISEVKEELK